MDDVTVDRERKSVTIYHKGENMRRTYMFDERGEWYEACGRDGEDRKTPRLSVMPMLNVHFREEREALAPRKPRSSRHTRRNRQSKANMIDGQFLYMSKFGDDSLRGAKGTSGYGLTLGNNCLEGAEEVFIHVSEAYGERSRDTSRPVDLGKVKSGVVVAERLCLNLHPSQYVNGGDDFFAFFPFNESHVVRTGSAIYVPGDIMHRVILDPARARGGDELKELARRLNALYGALREHNKSLPSLPGWFLDRHVPEAGE
jgi:hypothetical protein